MTFNTNYPSADERQSFIKDYLKANRHIYLGEPDFFDAFQERFPMYAKAPDVVAAHASFVRRAYDDLNRMQKDSVVAFTTISAEQAKSLGNPGLAQTKRVRLFTVNPFMAQVS